MRFNSTNGGAASLVVTILAKDVDGFELKRGGEAISVTLSSRGVTLQTIQAVYSPTSQRYAAEVAGLTFAGDFSIAVQTPLSIDVKATFTVACAIGYEDTPTGECLLPRSACDTATACTSRLAFTVSNTL